MSQQAISRGQNVGDALCLRHLWGNLPSPRSIITSPPYLDMHDYGNSSLIGFRGQSVEDYANQVTGLFQDCHEITTEDATLWVVAGSVRRNGRLLSLPDKLATAADEAGWTLREMITWDKQKALPWTHHGELRDVTEQLLLFSKSDDYRFDPSGLRSPIPNSAWWRRYPERYSPNGWLPTNLWSIPIPTQGSWTGVRNHLCPFPAELTYRMISLTTTEGDSVLDPLAGIGSVPAMAEAMGRLGYGLELTSGYVDAYDDTALSAVKFLSQIEEDVKYREHFRQTIIELRLLKFAKVLGKTLDNAGFGVSWVRARKCNRPPTQDYQVAVGQFDLVISDESIRESSIAAASAIVERPPLSKFGIEASIVALEVAEAATHGYWYESGRFWNTPEVQCPNGGAPHVVADFRPDPDRIDDTPYVSSASLRHMSSGTARMSSQL